MSPHFTFDELTRTTFRDALKSEQNLTEVVYQMSGKVIALGSAGHTTVNGR